MKHSVPLYKFYKNKYGSELLIDIVELKDIKRFLKEKPAHTLTYYDITFITEGKGSFALDNQIHKAEPCDVFFSKPGEIRSWDINNIVNGYALIFEDEFLSSFFKDTQFVQHLSYFSPGKNSSKLHLSDDFYVHILHLLQSIKKEIDAYQPHDVHLLRALLYEVLMLLHRSYQNTITPQNGDKHKENNIYVNRFIKLVEENMREQHSVRYYADRLCITPNYLNEIISSAMSVSAKQYIRNKLMDEAKRLLVYTEQPVSEIASSLHFSTVSYFIRSFRQYVGKTPLIYRQEQQP